MPGDNNNNGEGGNSGDNSGGAGNSGNRNDDSNYWRERSQRFEAQLTDKEKILQGFEGVDKAEFLRLKEEDEARRKDGIKTPEDIEAYVSEKVEAAKSEFGKKFDHFETEIAAKDALLKELQVHNVAKEKAVGVIDMDCWPLIQHFIDKHCYYEDDEIVIKDDDGQVRSSPENPRYNMTMEEYLAEIVEKQPRIAAEKGKKGTAKSLSGANSGGSNINGSMTLDEFAKLSKEERLAQPLEVRQRFQSQMFNTKRSERVKAADLVANK